MIRFLLLLFLLPFLILGIVWLVLGVGILLNALPAALLIPVALAVLWYIHQYFYKHLG
jgi:hypothetical protein